MTLVLLHHTSAPKYRTKTLDSLQKKCQSLFPDFKLEPLSHRRHVGGVTVLHSFVHKQCPSQMCELLLPIKSHGRSTRQASKSDELIFDTSTKFKSGAVAYSNSFVVSTSELWNSLPLNTRQIKSKQKFKTAANSFFKTNPQPTNKL